MSRQRPVTILHNNKNCHPAYTFEGTDFAGALVFLTQLVGEEVSVNGYVSESAL